MNYYKLLRLNSVITNPRIKLFGLYILHVLNKRYLAVHFDPVNACNLRCKMCYFTDQEYVKKLKGIFKAEELPLFAKAILGRALKLQVGCGTEPTLYKDLDKIFALASHYNVPHVSLTTNANLLEKEQLIKWAMHGLKEITVSLHGVFKETYEEMMGKGDFDRFLRSLEYITETIKQCPSLKLRVNYTFNEDNFDELKYFWKVFDKFDIDVLQLRPITKLGNTAYQNFSLEKILPKYDEVHDLLKAECKKKGTTLLAPKKSQLVERESIISVVRNYTYCYISPTHFWRKDFNWREETFNAYSSRTKWGYNLLKKTFSNKNEIYALLNDKLNYSIS